MFDNAEENRLLNWLFEDSHSGCRVIDSVSELVRINEETEASETALATAIGFSMETLQDEKNSCLDTTL